MAKGGGRVRNWRDIGNPNRRHVVKQRIANAQQLQAGQPAQTQPEQGAQLGAVPPVPAPVVDYATTSSGLAIKVKRKNNIPAPETNPNAASSSSTAWEKLFNQDLTPNPTGDPNFISGASNQDALAGTANWTDVSVQERKDILSNPKFYENNDITKYKPWMQQQILADPAFDWDQVPAWHKTFFEISSNPKIMASPMALAGAHAGSMFGLPGKVVGAAAGYTLGLVGGQAYDPTKGISEQPTATAKAMRVLNVLSEYAEQGAGYVGQVADAAIAGAQGNEQAAQAAKDMIFDPITREAAFEAGRLTYEYADFGGRAISNLMQMLSGEKEWAESGEDFVLGASGPVDKVKARGTNPLTGEEQYYTDVMQVLLETRKEIEAEIRAGGNPDEIVMRRLNEAAVFVGSQTQDLALQSVADPLEYLPKMTVNIGARVADIKGNKVAAEALKTTNAPIEAAQRYKTLVQTGQALTIDPSFQVDQMGWFSRMVAGVNKAGEVKAGSLLPSETGLLDPIKNKTGFLEEMTTQTPHSRAQTGAGMFYENIGTLLTMFDDPHEAGKYLQALSKGDNETWSQLGSRFANSAEFYTILPALKAFATEKLDGVVQSWDMTTVNREMLLNLSNILGEEASRLLDDLAKRGTSEQDYARIMDRLKTSNSPEARALLAEAQAGRFTVETLKQTVDIFTGEGALPWHPGQWKALMLDTLGSHFDEWVSKRLMLDKSPEAVSAFFRTTALMKQAQSILLLGGSPGYAITNGLSNMVHRAATGIYGYLTPTQINSFMDRMGVNPARFEEGVGIGGQVETKTGSGGPNTTAIDKAIKGTGALTTAKDRLGKISKGMPFSKLSAWFEKSESRQAFSIAMKQFWSASWRRGVGFSKMSPELVKVIGEMGIQPDRIYAAIEAGLNQAEIEKALYGRFEGVQARSLVHDAAQQTGMTAANAARLLDQIGVLDTLDAGLKNKTTPDGVRAVFERVNKQAQDWADMQTGADLKAMAEAVKQRVGLEGATAALDVAQHATSIFVDTWLDHYSRFGEVMNDLSLLDNPDMRNNAIDLSYQISDEEFRGVYARHAANYQGIFEAWGMSGNPDALNVLAAIGESDVAMRDAYRQMREIRKGHIEKYRNDFDNPAKWDEWDADTRKIDNLFKQAFAAKHAADVKMGASLGKIYESLHGPAAGEAARQWWEDVVKFNEEIVKREQDFRGEIAQARRAGVPKELIEARKQEYYSKTKVGMIVEVERINGEGIARLERVIKGSGGSGQAAAPTPPAPQTPPTPASVASDIPQPQMESVAVETPIPPRPAIIPKDDINAMLIAAEQRRNTEAAEIKARENQIWDVAEGYWERGSNYNREVLQHRFALVGALRKAEYGGMPDLTGLKDPRLTPEFVQAVLDARQLTHDVGIVEDVQGAVNNVRAPRINDNTTILRAISEHGGINKTMARDLTGEKRPKTAPGVFTNKGIRIDEMAIRLADDGYPIDVNDPNDPGGIAQTTELLNRARKGDKIYPIGHDHEAALSRAQDAAATKAFEESMQEVPFDQALWQADFADTIARADLTRMYELIGEFPEDLSASLTPEGETFADFMSRVADETAARVEIEAREEAVATHAARAQEATQEAATRAEAVTTRNLLKEKFQDVFGLSDEQAQTYMELSDAVAGWYEKVTGENADAFYTRYYADVVKVEGDGTVDGGRLEQESTGQIWYSKLTQTVEQITQPKMTVEQLRGALVKAGVKADEIKWMGLDDYLQGKNNVTKAEALEFLRENQVQMEEVTKGEVASQFRYGVQERNGRFAVWDNIDQSFGRTYGDESQAIAEADYLNSSNTTTNTKFSQYTLPGGEKYREVLFTLPNQEGSYQSGHWNEPNVLAHVRLNDRIDADGKRVLFVEEVQSDWHQAGREKGYRKSPAELSAGKDVEGMYKKFIADVEKYQWGEMDDSANKQIAVQLADAIVKGKTFSAQYEYFYNGKKNTEKIGYDGSTIYGRGHFPSGLIPFELMDVFQQDKSSIANAPFSKTWHEMVMKRTLRMAAEGGYDRVAWTTGEQQAARYDLAKQVDYVDSYRNPDGTYDILAAKDGNAVAERQKMNASQLADALGKDLANKIIAAEHDGTKPMRWEGKNLSVGGSGMRGFYDKILPDFMDKYGKKWGVKTGETKIPGSYFDENGKRTDSGDQNMETVHSVDVTDAMRESVMQGQPLFQAGINPKGAVTFDADGIKATIHAFEAGDFSTLVHENAHIFRRVLKDVAERTNNPQMRADLATIEEWAGVKNGEWNRAAEEKFARGFEEYVTTGKAPTPRLKRAFEMFKTWMLDIYKTVTGSAIDAQISDDVRRVFDRMLGAENTKVDMNAILYQLGYDAQKFYVDVNGDIHPRPSLDIHVDRERVQRQVNELEQSGWFQDLATRTKELRAEHLKRQEAAMARGEGWNSWSSYDQPPVSAEKVRELARFMQDKMNEPATLEGLRKMREQASGGADPNILFQADQPFGAYDAASQFHPESEVMDAGWAQHVRPLMDAMQDGAIKQLADRPMDGATRDLSPEGQAMLKTYMRQVQNEMATTKLATIRHGEQKRDFAMLNYSKRYGFDRVAEVVYPYQFYQSRTMVNWFLRAIDKPAFFSNYARLHNQMNRYERDIPERLRNKIKIPAPWLPEWAGDSLYIDPLGSLFPPATLLKPIERMMQDTTYQQIETERILQEWAADGRHSQTEIQQAAQTRSGTLYERAAEEAKLRRESEVNNPLDFMNTMFGPAWYLTTPYKLATGKGSEVNSTPMYNTIRGIDTVTQGTWAEPVGDLIGLLGKPEEWARKKLNLPEFGEYGDYYVDRQLANMVAEGSITSEQANIAMIERQGDFFDQARERVKMELALRVPTMGALYATLNGGAGAGAQAFLPSLFGSGLLPAGELEYRGLKQEWNEAWSQVDKGNKGAINLFFAEHPEYEAYLAKGKPPEERLKSFLIGQIWDGYMELGDTNKKQARAEMGDLFAQAFLNKETRSYDTLDVDTLTQWAQMLGQMVPKVPTETKATAESVPAPIKDTPKLDLLDKNITDITDQFFEQRATRFPNYYEQQAGYYALPRSEQAAYLLKNPEYADYVEWRNNWYDAYPQYKPIFNGDAFDRVDTSTWPPMLEDFVRVYAMTGQKLPSGAYKSLEQVWIEQGQPMGSFKSWLNSTVVPSMLYADGAPVQ